MTGFSGIDVADMVQQMMRAESMRLNRLTQQRQIFSWQQESLRSVTTNLNTFRNNWTDVSRQLTATTGIRNPDNFRGVTAQLNGGTTNTANGITVNTTANASAGNHSFRVTQVAQSDLFRSGNMNTGAIAGDFALSADNFASVNGASELQDLTFSVSVNGVSRAITISANELRNFAGDAVVNAAQTAHQTMSTAINTARENLANFAWNETGETAWRNANAQNSGETDAEYQTRVDTARTQFVNGFQIPLTAPAGASATFTQEISDANAAVTAARDTFNSSTGALAALNDALTTAASAGGANAHTNPATMAGMINDRLGVAFGTNPDGTTQRAEARIIDGSLVIRATAGNTANMLGNAEQLGFNPGSASLDLGNTYVEDLGLTAGTNFQIGTHTITIRENMSIQDLMNEVNQSGTGARISFASSTGQFTLEGTQTGEMSALSFTDGTANAATVMNSVFGININATFDASDTSGVGRLREAQNSVFEITTNGITSTMSRETNSFNDADLGLNITWNASAANATQATEINLAADTGNTRQLIMDFVNQYNDLISSLQDLSETARPRQQGGRGFFMPLTDEQRRGMSESEIRMWEEQARTGILHRDDTIRNLINDLRNSLSSGIRLEDGTSISLANIGIGLSPNWADGAILIVNEAELDAALANNIDGVAALFTGHGAAATNANGDPIPLNERSIASRLDDTIRRYSPEFGTDGILVQRAGRAGNNADTQSQLAQRIAEQDRRIENTMRWLERRETQLFAQFSRMEQAMMQAQQQMTFWDQIMFGAQ